MARLIPYLVTFVLGFVVAAIFFRRTDRAEDAERSAEWQGKYHDLLARYRELSRRLRDGGGSSSADASRYRQTLWDVRGMLRRPEGLTPEQAKSAMEEIDTALNS